MERTSQTPRKYSGSLRQVPPEHECCQLGTRISLKWKNHKPQLVEGFAPGSGFKAQWPLCSGDKGHISANCTRELMWPLMRSSRKGAGIRGYQYRPHPAILLRWEVGSNEGQDHPEPFWYVRRGKNSIETEQTTPAYKTALGHWVRSWTWYTFGAPSYPFPPFKDKSSRKGGVGVLWVCGPMWMYGSQAGRRATCLSIYWSILPQSAVHCCGREQLTCFLPSPPKSKIIR